MPLKPWNGTAFVEANELRVWNGSAWAQSQTARVWDGSSWVIFHRGGSANFTTDSFVTSGISDDATSPGEQAEVVYRINSDGFVYVDEQYSGLVQYEQWSTPAGFASNFEVRATLNSGNAIGDYGSWLDLATTRTWRLVIVENGFDQQESSQVSFEVRKKGSTTNLDTWTITFSVELTEI